MAASRKQPASASTPKKRPVTTSTTSKAVTKPPAEAIPDAAPAVAGTPPFVPAVGRIPILRVFPEVDGGRFPAKGFVGEVIPFGALVFREGHDAVGAHLELEAPDGSVIDRPLTRTH
ncbi:MAG: DUF3416 domain-containing protein, partial [Herbiconiux sp.]|nr:DUF3416 domain-containing protein [Herbiconiux sp.]